MLKSSGGADGDDVGIPGPLLSWLVVVLLFPAIVVANLWARWKLRRR
jgi:hypothetical protein